METLNMTSDIEMSNDTKSNNCDIGFDCTICFIYFQGSIIYLSLVLIALVMTCRDNAILRKRVLHKTNIKGLSHTIESVIPTRQTNGRLVFHNDLPDPDIESGTKNVA